MQSDARDGEAVVQYFGLVNARKAVKEELGYERDGILEETVPYRVNIVPGRHMARDALAGNRCGTRVRTACG